jgi:hypothetical protein
VPQQEADLLHKRPRRLPAAGHGLFPLKRRIPTLVDSLVSHVTMGATQPAEADP